MYCQGLIYFLPSTLNFGTTELCRHHAHRASTARLKHVDAVPTTVSSVTKDNVRAVPSSTCDTLPYAPHAILPMLLHARFRGDGLYSDLGVFTLLHSPSTTEQGNQDHRRSRQPALCIVLFISGTSANAALPL